MLLIITLAPVQCSSGLGRDTESWIGNLGLLSTFRPSDFWNNCQSI